MCQIMFLNMKCIIKKKNWSTIYTDKIKIGHNHSEIIICQFTHMNVIKVFDQN